MEPRLPDNPIRILHLEDSELDHQLVCRAITAAGLQFAIARVDTLADFSNATAQSAFDLILADYRLPGFTALDAWHALPPSDERPPFVLLSGAIGEAAAVAAIHMGISDFLPKDELAQLGRLILRTLQTHQTKQAKLRADLELARSEKRLAEFSEYLQTAIENERAAIAREIHDDIGGSLAAAKLDLAWISRHGADNATQEHIHAATEMLQHAIGASQRIMMNLRPSILDQGIFASVQWLAQNFEKRTGIQTLLRANNEHLSASKEVQLAAYRVAQEALTNVLKYANCSLVRIELSDAENVLTVEVSDNGKGISAQELEKPVAFGIRGMHERAKLVGGWLDISTQANVGTSVILSVPLTHAPQACKEDFQA
jgi:signal transduction histidine kinase